MFARDSLVLSDPVSQQTVTSLPLLPISVFLFSSCITLLMLLKKKIWSH